MVEMCDARIVFCQRCIMVELYPESCILVKLCIGRDVNLPIKMG